MLSTHSPEPALAASMPVASASAAPARPGRVAFLVGLLALAGCSSDLVKPYEATTDPAVLYMVLTLEHRAINLATAAPYHTIQLVATPRDGRGAAMSGLPAPSFRLENLSDTSRLQVTPDGIVTALAAGSRMAVIAELTAPGPIRHADTALISVTAAAPPVLATFSIHPLPPDSAVRASKVYDGSNQILDGAGLGFPFAENLTYRAADASGTAISDLVVEYESLDPLVATIDRWTSGRSYVRPGPARFVARTNAYGVVKADTATFTVTWPLSSTIVAGPTVTGEFGFEPMEIKIAPYGIVFFMIQRFYFPGGNQVDPVDVVFDNPSDIAMPPAALCGFMDFVVALGFYAPGSGCGTGNVLIPELPLDTDGDQLPGAVVVARQFPEPGIYPFHSTRTGTGGRIIVTSGPGETP